VFVEAHVETSGANDHVGGLDGAARGGFQETFEDASDFAFAPPEEAGVVSVAIDGDAVGDVVIPGDLVRAAPADEIAFDGVAIGMRTDGAAARMAGEIGRSFAAGRSWWLSGSGGRSFRSCSGGSVRGGIRSKQLFGGHALFFGYLGVSFRDRHEFPGGRTEARIGEFVKRVREVREALSGGRFVHGGLDCGRKESCGRADPAARRAEKSLGRETGSLVRSSAIQFLGVRCTRWLLFPADYCISYLGGDFKGRPGSATHRGCVGLVIKRGLTPRRCGPSRCARRR